MADFAADPIFIESDEEFGYDTDSTLDHDNDHRPQVFTLPQRQNSMYPDPETNPVFRDLQVLHHPKFNLRVGKTVQLRDGDFSQITLIVEHRNTKQVVIRGLRFRRNSQFKGSLEKKLNEVTLMLRYDSQNPRSIVQQSTETISLNQIKKVRKLIRTNWPYPAFNFRAVDPTALPNLGIRWLFRHGTLMCRWQYLENNKNSGCLESLNRDSCDADHFLDLEVQKFVYRGITLKGGCSPPTSEAEVTFNIQEREKVDYHDPIGFHRRATLEDEITIDLTIETLYPQRYTFGDAFCGAGGTSRGAKGAGLVVKWGFDFDAYAMYSFHKNFPNAKCWAIAAYDFIITVNEEMVVDVLHLSPPCQPFSPAHTRAGQDDEMNQASFFAIEEMLKKIKPRVVTLEETFGLTRTLDNSQWFRALIQIFTKLGFSVRWNVFDLRDFGLPQPRKRLFIFASWFLLLPPSPTQKLTSHSPGEPLPEFPEPTHCKPEDLHLFPNRHPWMTVNQAISDIPPETSLHDPDDATSMSWRRYDGDAPSTNTICCAGTIAHPNGRRALTLREIASLQGFPLEHDFGDVGKTKVRKQIGNAVPPIVAKTFFEQIVKTLKKTDGIED